MGIDDPRLPSTRLAAIILDLPSNGKVYDCPVLQGSLTLDHSGNKRSYTAQYSTGSYISGSPRNRTIFDWPYTDGLATPYKDLPSRNRNTCAHLKREPYLVIVSVGDIVHRVYKVVLF